MGRFLEMLLAFTRSWLSPTGPLHEPDPAAEEEPHDSPPTADQPERSE
ncbi:hypothetical protein ACWGID_09230 [Kribbella sp. NPDC054772]